MARKGWGSLSDAYRGRLQRQGITQEQYESGSSLAKARGHKSATHERAQSKAYRAVSKWLDEYMRTYGGSSDEIRHYGEYHTRDEVREAITKFGLVETQRAIAHQQRMERLYNAGQTSEASARFTFPPHPAYPDWIFYYHGAFS